MAHRECPGIVFPRARSLTSPRCFQSSRFGQTHLQSHPSVSVDTHTRVSLEAPLCLRGPPSAFLAPPPFWAFLSSKWDLSTSVWLLCMYQPSSQGWESLCTHPTLVPACFFCPRDQEVSCTLSPPTGPHSTWLAASHSSTALLFPGQNSSVALRGHPGQRTPLFVQQHIFPVTCQ
jgi:hypothetical protein